ncbi:hypothetical protein [Novosphingobium lindaniclasticum]
MDDYSGALVAAVLSMYDLYVLMGLAVVFLLGIFNFAAHKAVLESGHPMLSHIPWFFRPLGGRLSLLVEFAMLLGAMVMVAAGSSGWAWIYLLYSGLNGISAWLVANRRL